MGVFSLAIRDKLAQRMSSGGLAAGARLPPEPELAAELGVSRATLREALRSLEDGFVSRRRGAGTYGRTDLGSGTTWMSTSGVTP